MILPEWKVKLTGKGSDSQNDIWVLAKARTALVSIAIEGKVDESFGPTVGEWLKGASQNKQNRLQFLTEILGLNKQPHANIYYQLLPRTASAVIEAERFNASQAVMLVHSFSKTNQRFENYREFAALYGVDAKIGELISVTAKGGMPLHLGWVSGNPKYLLA